MYTYTYISIVWCNPFRFVYGHVRHTVIYVSFIFLIFEQKEADRLIIYKKICIFPKEICSLKYFRILESIVRFYWIFWRFEIYELRYLNPFLLLNVDSTILKFVHYFAQLAGKRSPEQEREAQEWIESILGKKFPPGETFEDVLKDGQVLCHLMNKLSPGSVPKINTTGGQFKMMENINM